MGALYILIWLLINKYSTYRKNEEESLCDVREINYCKLLRKFGSLRSFGKFNVILQM